MGELAISTKKFLSKSSDLFKPDSEPKGSGEVIWINTFCTRSSLLKPSRIARITSMIQPANLVSEPIPQLPKLDFSASTVVRPKTNTIGSPVLIFIARYSLMTSIRLRRSESSQPTS